MATTKMTRYRQLCKTPLLLISLSLLLASPSSAIELPKFGGKKEMDGAVTSAAAVANAKKLIDDMNMVNDAATGTVTSYQPGREKEPVTCNDIMAKALVVANEEKAAIIEERDSIVKAAGLISDRVDDLGEQLQKANDQIETLQQSIEDANAVLEEKLKEAVISSDERVRMVVEDTQKQLAKANNSVEEMKKHLMETQQNTANAILAEQEKSKLILEKLRNDTDIKIAAFEEKCKHEVAMKETETNKKLEAAKSSIEKAKTEAKEQIALKDEEIARKLEEAEKKIEKVKAEAADRVEASQKNADDKITSILSKAETDKEKIMDSNQAQITKLKKEMADQKKQMEEEMANLQKKAADDMKEVEEAAERRVQKAHEELEMAVAAAEAKIKTEMAEKDKTKAMLKEAMLEAAEKEKALASDIEQLKSSSSGLQNEISFWKQTHDSQGYCNMTMMRQDSGRILTRGMQSARGGLGHSQKFLMDLVNQQLAAAQRTGGDMKLYIEKEILPSVQSMYDKHLAEHVNKNVMPVYNQHIYPIYIQHIQPAYMQHVAPIVKTIEKDAAVAIEKSQKEAQKARSGLAALVKQSSSSAIKLAEEKEIDSMLPSWFMDGLEHSSKDGESVVDTIWKGALILVVILCRSLIHRTIGFCFSLIWFFCPLRLLVSRGSKDENASFGNTKPPQDKMNNGTKSDESKVSDKNVKRD